jgi:hypothetical protein
MTFLADLTLSVPDAEVRALTMNAFTIIRLLLYKEQPSG